MTNKLIAFLLLLSVANVSYGHPGHETLPVAPESATHYFFEPQHGYVYGVVMIAAAVACYFVLRKFKKI